MVFDNSSNVDARNGTFNEVHGNQTNNITNNVYSVLESLYKSASKGAAYDSAERRHLSGCLQGTRLDVIDQIMRWVDNPHGPSVFWLQGFAGTGKTTIAHTICDLTKAKELLCSSFFFSADTDDRCKSNYFFPTLAFQLSISVPALKSYLIEVLDEDSSIPDKSLEVQFKKLLLEPFRKATTATVPSKEVEGEKYVLADGPDGKPYWQAAFENHWQKTLKLPSPFAQSPSKSTNEGPTLGINTDLASSLFTKNVVVIDSLHECENEEDTETIIQLLAMAIRTSQLPLRILITSRSEPRIRRLFANDDLHSISQSLSLDDFDPRSDIARYFNHHLQRIPRDRDPNLRRLSVWPSQDQILKLVDKAHPSFVYAATVAAFIADKRSLPSRQLNIVLGVEDIPNATVFIRLDKLYKCIFRAAGFDRDPTRIVVAAVILLLDPLSIEQMEHLLHLEKGEVSLSMEALHSLFIVPEDETRPIQLFHRTVRDFLITPSRSEELYIEPAYYHGRFASSCFQLMAKELRINMCGLGDAKTPNQQIEGLDQRCHDNLSEALRYTSRFWAAHLQRAPYIDDLANELEAFAVRSLENWVELLSLLSHMPDCLPSIQNALSWLMDSGNERPRALEMLQNLQALVTQYYDDMRSRALFVYNIPPPMDQPPPVPPRQSRDSDRNAQLDKQERDALTSEITKLKEQLSTMVPFEYFTRRMVELRETFDTFEARLRDQFALAESTKASLSELESSHWDVKRQLSSSSKSDDANRLQSESQLQSQLQSAVVGLRSEFDARLREQRVPKGAQAGLADLAEKYADMQKEIKIKSDESNMFHEEIRALRAELKETRTRLDEALERIDRSGREHVWEPEGHSPPTDSVKQLTPYDKDADKDEISEDDQSDDLSEIFRQDDRSSYGDVGNFAWVSEDEHPSHRPTAQMLSNLQCLYCDRKMTTLDSLKQHLADTRSHDVFACCGRFFRNKDDFYNHWTRAKDMEDHEHTVVRSDGNENLTDLVKKKRDRRVTDNGNTTPSDSGSPDHAAQRYDMFNFYWMSEDDYPDHRPTARMMESLRCLYCDRQMDTLDNLKQHLSTTQSHDVFSCCERFFRNKDDFHNHWTRAKRTEDHEKTVVRSTTYCLPEI